MSALISASIFLVAWATRRFVSNGFFLALGIGYASVAGLDLIHALAYKGVGILDGGSADPATQLWIAARFVEVATLLSGFLFLARPAPPHLLRFVHLAVFALIVTSVFGWDSFPSAYADGVGLTPFKIYGEYVVIGCLLAAALLLVHHRSRFDAVSVGLLLAFFGVRAASELMFTTYASVYDGSNMVGHLLKTVADWFLYLAVVQRSLGHPYATLFKELGAAVDQARESEKRYRGLVQSQTDLVVRFDAEGCFTFVNDTACLTIGLSRAELLGRHWGEFVHTDDAAKTEETIGVAMAAPDRRASVEIRVLTVSGCRWFHWEGVAICDEAGSFVEFQAAGRDVTERVSAKAALRAARLEAERANEAKSRFLAAASHDLRQPFQAMILYQTILKGRLTDPRDRQIVEALGSAISSGKELLTALLDLSTLQAGTTLPNRSMIAVRTVLEPLAGQFGDLARERGLEFRFVPCSASVVTDPVLLTRMVRNLLVNALKYTRTGSILLGCRLADGDVRIEVWDSGPGIPPDKHDEIFEEFTQLDNPSRDRSRGLGLGLSVVAKTGQLLGHPVGVRSELGKGSMFYVQVPMAAEEARTEAVAPADCR